MSRRIKRFLFAASLSSLGMLVACATASTRVFPKDNGTHLMVASSSTESWAYDAALKDSEKYCQVRGKRFVMIKQRSKYQGMDKNAKAAINTFGMIAQQPTYGATSSGDDYRIEVLFRCK